MVTAISDKMDTGLRLAWISVRNFRSLHKLDLLPIQEAVTVVAGQNDGGKTSLLDAIAFLLGQKVLDSNDVSHHAANEEQIEVEGVFFTIDDPQGNKQVTIRARWHAGRRVAELLVPVHPALQAEPEEMSMAQLREAAGRLLDPVPRSQNKAPFIEALREWLDKQPVADLEPQWVTLPRELEYQLPKLQVFSSTTAVDPVRSIQQMVRTTSQALIQSDQYNGRLSAIEKDLIDDLRQHMRFVEDRIRDHCDDLDGVSIEPAYDFSSSQPATSVQFIRNDRSVDYNKVGEGRQRKTTLAVYEANSDALRTFVQTTTYILVYDEPDSHLDYSSQKRVAKILEAQASLAHVQVVVATHSRNLIDMVPLEAVLSLRLNEELKTEALNLADPDHESEIEFQSELYVSLGFSNSTFLDEKIFLVVEGMTEIQAVPILFQMVSSKSIVASGVQMVSLEGTGSTKEVVKRLRTAWKKQVIVLLDEDSRSKYSDFLGNAGFREGVDLFFIGTKEFEDSFPDDLWLKTLERDFPAAADKAPWDLNVFTGMRNSNKFSRALRDRVEQRTGIERPNKAELGRCVAITCQQENRLPDALRKCFERVVYVAS